MQFVEGLRCRECARPYPAEALHVCEWCFGPLEVVYDYEAISASISREKVAAGPLSIWRYAVAACDPAWDDSDQDAFHTARQTAWKLAVPGHVRAARPPRASLLQKDFRVWSSYGDASIQKAACRLVHTCERFVHSCPLVPLLDAGNCLCFVQTYTT